MKIKVTKMATAVNGDLLLSARIAGIPAEKITNMKNVLESALADGSVNELEMMFLFFALRSLLSK